MDYLDRLADSLLVVSGDVMTAYAIGAGIDPNGSFFRRSDFSEQTQRKTLGRIHDVHVTLPPPPAPPAQVGAAHQYRWCIYPKDYGGLGVDAAGAFSMRLLVEHCQAMPSASEQAAREAFSERPIVCQSIGCANQVHVYTEWVVCGGCRLAVFCQACAKNSRGCRTCLIASVPTTLPLGYMTKHILPDQTPRDPALDTTIRLLAAQAAYRISGPPARQAMCRSSSSRK